MIDSPAPFDLPGIRLGVVRGISYGVFGRPGEFVPQARALGAGLVRAYLYWGQIEPEPGRYVWDTVNALLDQLDGDEEVWITLCSSSLWATRQPTDFLPPSPAHDLAAYGEFVRRTVRHCAGRARYWQCDNEPSNTQLLWAGTAAEYVTQLKTMYGAVKDTDPTAAVVLGGCGYDVLSSEIGSEPRQFFDHLVRAGRDDFDLFDVHLYGDVTAIPAYLDTARELMRAHGYLKPVVVGEYAGPVPFEFPEVGPVLQQTLAAAFAEAPATQSKEELVEREQQETPERRAMGALYDRMPDLPPTLQMFLEGCPPEVEALRDRINCRQVVMRNLLALAGGVRRTVYWNLAPEVPEPVDPRQMMHLMFGKLPLLAYEDRSLTTRRPAAEAFALLVDELAGVESVHRLPVAGRPTVYAFEVQRADRPPLLVLWDHRDQVAGENEPAVRVDVPWNAPAATSVDVFGEAHATSVRDGELSVDVSITPLFVTAEHQRVPAASVG
jgi:hypothetical protein